jgi:hypothetical protein
MLIIYDDRSQDKCMTTKTTAQAVLLNKLLIDCSLSTERAAVVMHVEVYCLRVYFLESKEFHSGCLKEVCGWDELRMLCLHAIKDIDHGLLIN